MKKLNDFMNERCCMLYAPNRPKKNVEVNEIRLLKMNE